MVDDGSIRRTQKWEIFSLELSSDAHIWQYGVESSVEWYAITWDTKKNLIPSSPILTKVGDGPRSEIKNGDFSALNCPQILIFGDMAWNQV